MKRKSTATNTLDSQLGRAMRKVLEQMEKSEERKEKPEERESEDYRRGGKVRGPGTATSDSILARISNGEYILPKPAVDMVGANNLEAIRLEALRRSGVTPNAASPRDNMGRKKYLQGGAITGIGRYVAKNPEKALSMALGKVANVGTGYGGGLGMLLNSQDAVAPTLDVTKEEAYQRAYNAVQAGKGKTPNLREWNITSNLIPPSNQEVLDSYNQKQAETDAMIRAQGGIAPSDRRALADMNRFNPRAYAPGYALGGLAFGGSGLNTYTPGESTSTTFFPSTTINPMTTGTAIGGGMRQPSAQPAGSTNQYGNDMSLTNRMNTSTDQLRAMRTGLPAATPTTPQQSNLQQPDFMTGLKSLLNPQQQAQDAYKAARGRADALDVASGRFDREYAPGFKYGGMVSKEQWDRLPRFVLGGRSWTPSQLVSVYGPNPPVSVPQDVDLARVAAQRAADTAKATAAMSGPASAARLVPGGYGAAPSIGSRVVSGLGSLGARAAGGIGMMMYPSELGQGTLDSPEAQRAMAANKMAWRGDVPETIDMKSSTPIPVQTSRTLTVAPTPNPDANPAIAPSLSQAILPSPGQEASRRMGLKQLTTDLDSAALRAAGAYQVPGTDIYRQVEPAPGFGPANPNRVPAPGQIAGTTTYTVPGETGMGGGTGQAIFQGLPKQGGSLGYVGTPETKGMTQAEATAYNVANLNRQYEALKSRNEAYGLGGGNVGSALPAAPAPVDIWARPGDSFGDSQMRQAQYESLLNNAGQQRGVGAKRRAAAMIGAAQALVAPGLAAAKMNAEQAQAYAQGLMGLQTSERQTQASERQKEIAAQQARQAAEQAQQNWQYERDQADRQKAQDLAVRLYGQQAKNQTRPAMLPEKAISDIMNRFAVPGLPGQPSTQDFGRFNAEYSAAPIPTDRSQMQAGQVYYDPSDPASPYKIATPQGMRQLGGMRDLIIYRHMTNPAARGALPAGKADEEG